ncbi:MAG: flavodoxin family protein [Candidatus Bathyarchaeota archaeon]|nr:flavodoxin family protein [Candidatus Bathyarchaeota archaeon]
MAQVLGIVGSPRVGGNTELLVTEALKAVEEEGAEIELVRLAGKEIKSCDGCVSCRETKSCHIKDDFAPVFEKMVEADGIIMATPVYFSSATPLIKALIDRAGYLSIARGRVFENKVGGAMAVARRAGQNFAFAQLLFFLLHQGMIVPGSTYWNVAFGGKKGDVSNDEEGLATARNFGKKMVWLIRKIKGSA